MPKTSKTIAELDRRIKEAQTERDLADRKVAELVSLRDSFIQADAKAAPKK